MLDCCRRLECRGLDSSRGPRKDDKKQVNKKRRLENEPDFSDGGVEFQEQGLHNQVAIREENLPPIQRSKFNDGNRRIRSLGYQIDGSAVSTPIRWKSRRQDTVFRRSCKEETVKGFHKTQQVDAPRLQLGRRKRDSGRTDQDDKGKSDTSPSDDIEKELGSKGTSLYKERAANVEMRQRPKPQDIGASGARTTPDGQLGQTVRPVGIKDRHSKVTTAKGLRDRRVRLSPATAIQFFDVQDRLGFEQPSKAVDWLIEKAKAAIDELAKLPSVTVSHKQDAGSDFGCVHSVSSGPSTSLAFQAGGSNPTEDGFPAACPSGMQDCQNDKCEHFHGQDKTGTQTEEDRVPDEASGSSARHTESRTKGREPSRKRTKLERTSSRGSKFVFQTQQRTHCPTSREAFIAHADSMSVERKLHLSSINRSSGQNPSHSDALQNRPGHSFHGMPNLTDHRTQRPSLPILPEEMNFGHQQRRSHLELPAYPLASSSHSYTEELRNAIALSNPGRRLGPYQFSEPVDLWRLSFNQQLSDISCTPLLDQINYQSLPSGSSESNASGQVTRDSHLFPQHSSHATTSGLFKSTVLPLTAEQFYQEWFHLHNKLPNSTPSTEGHNAVTTFQPGPGPPFQRKLFSNMGTLQSIFSPNPSPTIYSSMNQSTVHANESGDSMTPCSIGNRSNFHVFASKIPARIRGLDESDGIGLPSSSRP